MMGNILGVKWPRGVLRTKDIDIAHDAELHVTIPDHEIDLESILQKTGDEFLPVPSLNRDHPSTTFKIRGAELSVSLLTPLRGKPDSSPRRIRPGDLPPALDAATQMPTKFTKQLTSGLQQLSPDLRQALTE